MGKRAVFVGAHPDDIEYGCAGTILKYRDWETVFILMSCGKEEPYNRKEERRAEQQRAADRLGVKAVVHMDLPDGGIQCSPENSRKLAALLAELAPDLIFVNSANDAHRDHIETARLVMDVCRQKDNLIFYRTYSSVAFQPHLFVDISSWLEEKERVLSEHRSQLEKYTRKKLFLLETMIMEDKVSGMRLKTEAAEGFVLCHVLI